MSSSRRSIIISLLTETIQEDESSSSSSLSDSTDDETIALSPIKRKRICLRARTENYVELTIHLYSDSEFKSHFRLTRSTFEFLLGIIGQQLARNKNDGRQQVDPEKQLMIALWRMGNTECYRSICDRFNVSKSTAHLCVSRVTKALVEKINIFIKWPSPTEVDNIKRGFETMSGFPDTIGVIDGTHIEIEVPKKNPQDYINRKGYASIQLQAVCDNRRAFSHIFVGFPGSTHDQRVLRNSPIDTFLDNSSKFPENTHLVGDAAYTIHPKLLTPFKDNGNLSAKQKNYNFCLSSARMTIERSFGLLKGRWRSLLNCLPMQNIKKMPQYIAACCIIHNICVLKEDDIQLENLRNDQVPVEPRILVDRQDHGRRQQEGQNKRNFIMNGLAIRHV